MRSRVHGGLDGALSRVKHESGFADIAAQIGGRASVLSSCTQVSMNASFCRRTSGSVTTPERAGAADTPDTVSYARSWPLISECR